jgi:hypothetical protein
MNTVIQILCMPLALMIAAAPLPLLAARRGDGTVARWNANTSVLSESPGPWTVALWVKFTDHGEVNKRVLWMGKIDQSTGVELSWGRDAAGANDADQLSWWMSTGAAGRFDIAEIADSNWHHLVVTKLSATGSIYWALDGGTLTEAPGSGGVAMPTIEKVTVFGVESEATWCAEADVEDLAVWARSLSQTEVAALYAGRLAGHLPNQDSRVAYWPMLGNTSANERDQWGRSDLIWINGSADNVAGPTFSGNYRALHIGSGYYTPLYPALQAGWYAARDAVLSDPNGKGIEFAVGTHSLTERVELRHPQAAQLKDFMVRGQGQNRTVLKWAGGSDEMFRLTMCDGVRFEDITLDGSGTATVGHRWKSISGLPSTANVCRDVTFQGFTKACVMIGTEGEIDANETVNNNDYATFDHANFSDSARGFYIPVGTLSGGIGTASFHQSLAHRFIACTFGQLDTALEINSGGSIHGWQTTFGAVNTILKCGPNAGDVNTGPITFDGCGHWETAGANTGTGRTGQRWMKLLDLATGAPITVTIDGMQMTSGANGNFPTADPMALMTIGGGKTVIIRDSQLYNYDDGDYADMSAGTTAFGFSESVLRISDTAYVGDNPNSSTLFGGWGDPGVRVQWEKPMNYANRARTETVTNGDR